MACQLETSCYGFRNLLLHFLIMHANQSLNDQPEVKAHYTKSVIWRLVEPVYSRLMWDIQVEQRFWYLRQFYMKVW